MILFRTAIGAAPDEAVAIGHAAGVLAVGGHLMQHLAGLEIQQPGFFNGIVVALFLHPETLAALHRDRIGPAGRGQEQFRGPGLAAGKWAWASPRRCGQDRRSRAWRSGPGRRRATGLSAPRRPGIFFCPVCSRLFPQALLQADLSIRFSCLTIRRSARASQSRALSSPRRCTNSFLDLIAGFDWHLASKTAGGRLTSGRDLSE